MTPNSLLSANTFESRAWAGPFQSKNSLTKDFYVVPVNFNFDLFRPLDAQPDWRLSTTP
jgi:hypothetical protein